jgi:hypothetical protein
VELPVFESARVKLVYFTHTAIERIFYNGLESHGDPLDFVSDDIGGRERVWETATWIMSDALRRRAAGAPYGPCELLTLVRVTGQILSDDTWTTAQLRRNMDLKASAIRQMSASEFERRFVSAGTWFKAMEEFLRKLPEALLVVEKPQRAREDQVTILQITLGLARISRGFLRDAPAPIQNRFSTAMDAFYRQLVDLAQSRHSALCAIAAARWQWGRSGSEDETAMGNRLRAVVDDAIRSEPWLGRFRQQLVGW